MLDIIEYDSSGWATYIYGRRTTFKAHAHLGLAKFSLSVNRDREGKFKGRWGAHDMGLYQLAPNADGKLVWKLHTVIKVGTTQGDYPEIWKSKTTPGGNDVQHV